MHKFLSVEDVSRIVQRHPVTVRRAIQRGHLQAKRLGGRFIVSPAALEHWTGGHEVITQAALAKKLGLPLRTLNNWCVEGKVPFIVSEGRKTRDFDEAGVAAVKALMAARRSSAKESTPRAVDSFALADEVRGLRVAVERIAEALESWVTRPSA